MKKWFVSAYKMRFMRKSELEEIFDSDKYKDTTRNQAQRELFLRKY